MTTLDEHHLEQHRQLLLIDRDRLDDELVRQASDYYKCAEEAAFAVSRRDAAKESMARVAATVLEDLLAKPENAKLTDTKAKMLVEADARYVDAKVDYGRLAEESQRWSALVTSMDQRGSALRKLTDLYVAGYFQPSSTRHEGGAEGVAARQGREAMSQSRDRRRLQE